MTATGVKLKRVYLEITNMCNLSCAFCHGTSRQAKQMSTDEYVRLVAALEGKAAELYFHLLGEPLLHPDLVSFIAMAREHGFHPCVTTNGTLLAKRGEELAVAAPYRVSVSLHSAEANGAFATEEYLSSCISFARKAAANGSFVALRLWNSGGMEEGNASIMSTLKTAFPGPWVTTRSGMRMADRIFLERGELFDWPDLNAREYPGEFFCHGVRDQIGVLVDGTVVPCCLDAEGVVPLGNLFETGLDDILESPRAEAIRDGFTRHEPVEALCRRCGYAAMHKMH